MNPRTFDVQLLLVFDALMTERHVTRAANLVGLSQSAFSHALGRLRARFDDPLFVRTAQGMEPTARSFELADPVREALRQVEFVFSSRPSFIPEESTESFVIRVGESNEFLLLPEILTHLRAMAPHISLVVRHLSPKDTANGLEDGTVDLAISAFLTHSKSIRSTELMRDRMICAMSAAHPAAQRRLTMERFLALSHIRVVHDAGDIRFVDEALHERGKNRRVIATIPHWLIALHTVINSEMVVAASERLVRRFDVDDRMVVRELPVGGQDFYWRLYWHRRHDDSPSQRWIRTLVSDVCTRIDGVPAS